MTQYKSLIADFVSEADAVLTFAVKQELPDKLTREDISELRMDVMRLYNRLSYVADTEINRRIGV